jgi:defect in organelle trafficking protein DotB
MTKRKPPEMPSAAAKKNKQAGEDSIAPDEISQPEEQDDHAPPEIVASSKTSASKDDTVHLFENEPTRFSAQDMERLLLYCHELNASDITLQTNEPVYAEIHGRLSHVTKRSLSNTEVGELLNAIYGPNGTAQILTGHDVDTHYELKPLRGERYRYRVNATGCQTQGHDGIQITLRTIPTEPPDLDWHSLPDHIIEACQPEDGVVYVTGATGSGKSTLLASVIKHIALDPDCHRKILTYESPIEFVYDMLDTTSAVISQSEVPRHLPNFSDGVRNALRRKPKLILVGEARDAETMASVIEAALTGHPVYTTLHSNGVAETIRRLVGTFPAEERHGRTLDIIETMRLIIWQRLVPTVDGERVALREYMIFDDKIRDMLLDTPVHDITAKTRQILKKHGHPMAEDAKEKYKQGRISKRTYELIVRSTKHTDKDITSN